MEQRTLWEGSTAYGRYQIVDTLYDSRPARVLYSGDRQAAQSGIAKDGNLDLLFDYNQRMFELACGLQPQRVLLIGGAVMTLPKALLAALPDVQIEVVEPDGGLTDLGYRFFDVPADERLRVVHTDGRQFLRKSTGRYDLVLVDAFVHTVIPRDLRTAEAFAAFASHLRPGGVLAMNVISGYYGQNSVVLRQTTAAAQLSFGTVQAFLASRGYSLWLPQNFVLTAQQTADPPLGQYMRHDIVELPEVSPAEETLHD